MKIYFNMDVATLIGPFSQILPMTNMPLKGALNDKDLDIIEDGGILIKEGKIIDIGQYDELLSQYPNVEKFRIYAGAVALPSFIDCHTHLCFDGSRAMDFSERNAGTSYQEIAKAGGGIWSSVKHTRAASKERLVALMIYRSKQLIKNGIGTVEIKSGYGLNVEQEIKMLEAIQWFNKKTPLDVVSTCLAAHIIPKEFKGDEEGYLAYLMNELLPLLKSEKLSNRIDAFVEENAFSVNATRQYFNFAESLGFDLTVHGDQFSVGGSALAVELDALSVDHLEVSGENEINLLARSETIPVALPGASLGIGCAFTPARKLLNAGASLAIASDWNPGSAPMGNLIAQASILASFEKLSNAEVLAGLTYRGAAALNIFDK
ncbi:MAG: imidazolonepropionase, partial [Bacteroidota bacterium]